MKASITFDLPDESTEHKHALNGQKYFVLLCEINEFLRHRDRCQNDKYASKLREIFYEGLSDNEIFLNE